MPKEHKKRGRHAEQKKRKLEQADEEPQRKKRKSVADNNDQVEQADTIPLDDVGQPFDPQTQQSIEPNGGNDMPFYGLLDEEEQEYFKRADEMLELNQFGDPEERDLFLANVYREADGKELKIACSQSCSRLMERLIFLSSAAQLKKVFQKFSGHFLHLVQHRFASHCCEKLFVQSAAVVTKELSGDEETKQEANSEDVFVSMENLFLYSINELQDNLGYLLTDKFASHVLRVLLVVLSGEPLVRSPTKSVIQSKRKENITVSGFDKQSDLTLPRRPVPESFLTALEKLINDSVSGLDTDYLRTLSTHPTGNPVLQLLLQLELTKFGKQRANDENSMIHKLLPDDPISEGTESASFINGLVYDSIGSRLLETILENAPGKMFKALYKEFFRDRMGTLARNDIAGYVVSRILGRLSKEDLEAALENILPHIKSLIERSRVTVVKTLIERCGARGVDSEPIGKQIEAAYSDANGFHITRLLKLSDHHNSNVGNSNDNAKGDKARSSTSQPEKVHGSSLAQTMVSVPGPIGALIFDSLSRLGTALSLEIARDSIASRAVQAALTSPHASVIFRRKMIQQFYGNIGSMALDPSASHVIDAVWEGTHGLAFIRERIAEELAENEASLRESFVGRAVWRNWKMDLYKRRRKDWVLQSRNNAGNNGFLGFPEAEHVRDEGQNGRGRSNSHGHGHGHGHAHGEGRDSKAKLKTGIELAREKHVKDKARKHSKLEKEHKVMPGQKRGSASSTKENTGHMKSE